MDGNTEYGISVSQQCDRNFRTLFRKNRSLAIAVEEKLSQIRANPRRFKPLRHSLAGCFRVHILGSFVLIYKINESERIVELLRFAHHDEAYC